MVPTLGNRNWNKLGWQHYKAFQSAYKDRSFKYSRLKLDSMSSRLTPKQRGQYSTAKCAVGLVKKNNTEIGKFIRDNIYVNDRLPGKAKFTDRSKLKVGKQSIVNRLTFMNSIDFPWYDISISDDLLRRNLNCTNTKLNRNAWLKLELYVILLTNQTRSASFASKSGRYSF